MNRTPFSRIYLCQTLYFLAAEFAGLHGQICTTRTIAKADNACHNDSKSSLSGYAYCQKDIPSGSATIFPH